MSDPIRIWLEVSHHGPFRLGGWAFVRAAAGDVTGYAGGERRIEAERTALLGLLAALKDAAGPVELRSASPAVLAIPARLRAAQAGENPPADNLDLWAQAVTALASGAVRLLKVEPAPRTPAAFAAAWAELARDKAKTGAFVSAIPKPNLTQAGVG